jgi:hypothetical protein
MRSLFIASTSWLENVCYLAKEMIGMVCNMLEGTNPEQAKLYRQRLANLISQ